MPWTHLGGWTNKPTRYGNTRQDKDEYVREKYPENYDRYMDKKYGSGNWDDEDDS